VSDFVAYDIALVPLIIGLVRIFTGLGMPKKWAPLLALGFGIVGGVVYIAPGQWSKGILVGITMGLAASGLYSGTKHWIESFREKNEN
jgi:hypothetical protein